MTLVRRVLAALLSAAALTLGSVAVAEPKAPVRAEKPAAPHATLELLVLHATNSRRGIDARVQDLHELTKAPFSSYDSYTLIDQVKLPLEKAQPKTRRLPNGRVLEARLLDVLEHDFVRISARINQPGAADFLPLLEVKAKLGQHFIVAGQRYKSGILVLVLRVLR
jgi:hypothetical protein